MSDAIKIINNCKIGKNTKVYNFANLYGCEIGENCRIGSFVEIQKGVKIGNRVKIESHTFICEGVTIEDDVFIGHHVVFINDKYPHASKRSKELQTEEDWKILRTLIGKGASIGSNATILGGITISDYAMVGAGSVVTKDILPYTVVIGNPAKIIRKLHP